MKKIKLLFLLFTLIPSTTIIAQVGINTDGTTPNSSAILDLKSNDKGFLPPRMSQAYIESIQNPADGLMVYNTDDNSLYIYVLEDNKWKEIQFGSGEISLQATYTIGSGNTCTNTTVNGNYYSGTELDATNTIIIDANVSEQGTYSITTSIINGYSFSGSGVFSSTGTVQVTLTGNGTPITDQTDNFTATASNNSGICSFDIVVATPLVPVVTNPITNRIWMDRNLGASQVATSSTDANAYGDLYQWGRYTEGHETRTSYTTTTTAYTSSPGAGYTWSGKFIKVNGGMHNWLSSPDETLWQGVSGTNNPCPSGFRLPTENEWNAELQSWTTNNSSGAFGSVLKLTNAGYREYSAAGLVGVGTHGKYWSSSADAYFETSTVISFYNIEALIMDSRRGTGHSIRCIKNNQ